MISDLSPLFCQTGWNGKTSHLFWLVLRCLVTLTSLLVRRPGVIFKEGTNQTKRFLSIHESFHENTLSFLDPTSFEHRLASLRIWLNGQETCTLGLWKLLQLKGTCRLVGLKCGPISKNLRPFTRSWTTEICKSNITASTSDILSQCNCTYGAFDFNKLTNLRSWFFSVLQTTKMSSLNLKYKQIPRTSNSLAVTNPCSACLKYVRSKSWLEWINPIPVPVCTFHKVPGAASAIKNWCLHKKINCWGSFWSDWSWQQVNTS